MQPEDSNITNRASVLWKHALYFTLVIALVTVAVHYRSEAADSPVLLQGHLVPVSRADIRKSIEKLVSLQTAMHVDENLDRKLAHTTKELSMHPGLMARLDLKEVSMLKSEEGVISHVLDLQKHMYSGRTVLQGNPVTRVVNVDDIPKYVKDAVVRVLHKIPVPLPTLNPAVQPARIVAVQHGRVAPMVSSAPTKVIASAANLGTVEPEYVVNSPWIGPFSQIFSPASQQVQSVPPASAVALPVLNGVESRIQALQRAVSTNEQNWRSALHALDAEPLQPVEEVEQAPRLPSAANAHHAHRRKSEERRTTTRVAEDSKWKDALTAVTFPSPSPLTVELPPPVPNTPLVHVDPTEGKRLRELRAAVTANERHWKRAIGSFPLPSPALPTATVAETPPAAPSVRVDSAEEARLLRLRDDVAASEREWRSAMGGLSLHAAAAPPAAPEPLLPTPPAEYADAAAGGDAEGARLLRLRDQVSAAGRSWRAAITGLSAADGGPAPGGDALAPLFGAGDAAAPGPSPDLLAAAGLDSPLAPLTAELGSGASAGAGAGVDDAAPGLGLF
jgi:hypothetical protein